MNILLVGAMQSEIEYFLNNFELQKIEEINNFKFYICKYHQKNIYLVESGVGKAMAGLLIGVASTNFKIDKVINIGIAGGIKPATLNDVIACDKYVYGDVDVTFFEKYQYGQMAGCPKLFNADTEMMEIATKNNAIRGTICTNDAFISSYNIVKEIKNKLGDVDNIMCFDMESCAFAQACHMVNIPFIAIRSISDLIDDTNQEEVYDNNGEKPSVLANILVLKIIIEL